MAIAFDAASNVAAGTGNLSWTHTPVGTPRGVLVYVVQNTGASSQVSSVTYGGVSLSQVSGSPNVHGTGEPGVVSAWFLGSGVPTGARTVAVTVSGTASKRAVCFTVTAADDTSVQATNVSINSDSVANPSSTLLLGGVPCWVSEGFHSGQNAVSGITELSGWTAYLEHDFGNQTAGWYRYNTVGSSDVTVGWTQTADDAVCIAVALREGVPSGPPVAVYARHYIMMAGE